MSKYNSFIFKSYSFDAEKGTAEFTYSFDNAVNFNEVYRFDFQYKTYDRTVLDQALQTLFFLAGVSYYKAYVPKNIVVEAGTIDAHTAAFLSRTYQKGLGEFFYVNKLDPAMSIEFPVTSNSKLDVLHISNEGILVGIGGGKDSLVSVELLRDKADITTWSVGHGAQLDPLVERIALPHLWVERTWDAKLLELNNTDAYNGHVPISAIFAAVGTVVAVLAGKRDIVVSNENSANEPTLTYQNIDINHQYSKSLEFEMDYQTLLAHYYGDSLRYYSLLRPLSELRIAEIFSNLAFQKYKDTFSSCNRAFTHTSTSLTWCGNCPKCAFVFLALTPFTNKSELEQLWGKNLLLDKNLTPIFRQLLGIEGDKPLECVGEIQESRAAMHLAQVQYPELLERYSFEIPENYNFREQYGHSIPRDIYNLVQSSL